MADQGSRKFMHDDVQLLKKTKISVFVDEALSDILVVTFEFGVKIFRGVLLDSTKRNLPCGVTTLNPAFNISKADDDLLYSVNQRFAYTEPHTSKNRKVHISTKYKTNKMTVRLRPRQVLCSKCKGICNENSENVTRKRKNSDSVQLPIKRSANAPVTRSVHSETNKRRLHTDNKFLSPAARDCTTLTRNEQSSLKRRLLPSALSEEHCTIVTAIQDHLEADSRHSVEHSDYSQDQAATKRPLRKRKTGESSAAEDLWEEDDFGEETSRNNNQNTQNNANIDQRLLLTSSGGNSTCVNTRTIKISYGPQGEGTVLKIPAQIENLNVSDSEENIKIEATKLKDENNKAARKALKKAKKEARKKVLYAAAGGGTTLVPSYLGGSSPRLSGSSPRYLVGGASPRLGAVSPRYNMTCDVSSSRRKKHKVKHKKKHRDDKEKKHKEVVEEAVATTTTTTIPMNTTAEDVYSKEQIVTQKLSINLKRLHNTYTTSCRPPDSAAAAAEENDDDSAGSEDFSGDQVPNFPPLNSPLVVRLNAQPAVAHAVGANGCRLFVGDVVWGKIHGFPWWPGKILSITCGGGGGCDVLTSSNGATVPQAHVSWYGSPTSSLIQCDQLGPFLENFKIRYNKRKRGPYKEAVKQATTEARENAENKPSMAASNSPPTAPPPPPPRNIINVVPPALASPREIDVVS